MNILSLNIRGMGNSHKIEWLSRLRKENCFSFCGIQESRLSSVSSDIGDWWGSSDVEYEAVSSIGKSGGIISFWDKNLFQVITTIKSNHFLAAVGYWNGILGETIIVNVYAPQSPSEKKNLWNNLRNLMNSRVGNWIIFGDFNVVRKPDERLNSTFCPSTAAEFNKFITDTGLLDLNMGGRKFTYFCVDGCKLSKLDRFLVCPRILASFPTASVTAFPREYSDHSPVLKLIQIDKDVEVRVLSDLEIADWKFCKQRIIELEKLAKLDLIQKSRIKWLSDGDENSRFFHNSIKIKNRRSNMHGLMINGNWITDVEAIKQETWSFFAAKFHENYDVRPPLINTNFKMLSDADRCFLEAPFSLAEIKEAICNCGCEKAPGPDGFTFKFIKHFWHIMQDDIMRFVKHFESYACLSRGSNSSFISLLPKVKDPLHLNDFRPISLIGCVYKIIAKALASRIKKVIGTVIDEVQTAFIEGRNILDGPLIINELCSWAKK